MKNQDLKFIETTTSCGNVFRADFNGCRLEMGLNKNWLNIIDDNSRCECCSISSGGDIESDSGEVVTGDWSDADWRIIRSAINAA